MTADQEKQTQALCIKMPATETNSSFESDPQNENHKSRYSEEEALICDGAAIHRDSSSGKGPSENQQEFLYLTMVNNSPEGKSASFPTPPIKFVN